MSVQEALEKYKRGEHIHLGDEYEGKKREECNEIDQEIVDAIYEYEVSIGGIRMENGLMVYAEGVLERLPRYRDCDNITCCRE